MSVELRGDCLRLTETMNHEVVLCGPRDTGKSVAGCSKVHMYARVPKAKLLLVRKTRASMAGTILRTLERTIVQWGGRVQVHGGKNPERYIYGNGAEVWVAGMDDPGKALSGEWDAVYVCQAEELAEEEWETLAACASGRGAVVAHTQIFGDCNPGPPNHWILRRAKKGQLQLLRATHRDNPELYTPDGTLTQEGEKRLAVLRGAYTGLRAKRMVAGEWAAAEGAVYEFSRLGYDAVDEQTGRPKRVGPHMAVRSPREMRRWFLACDDGTTHPAVILIVGEDSDGRWHVFKEFHKPGVLISARVAISKEWFSRPMQALGVERTEEEVMANRELPGCDFAAVDEAAAGLILEMTNAGVYVRPGKGRVVDGIQRVQNRLACSPVDGRPRLTFDPGCTETMDEFEAYHWDPKSAREVPVKEDDHGPDAVRYLDDAVAEPDGAWTGKTAREAAVGGAHPGIQPRRFEPRHFTPRKL